MFKEAAGIKRIVIKTGRTDMRKGISGLASLIQLQHGFDLYEKGTLFLFCGRKTDRIKGIVFEGDGICMIIKRLSGENRFQWPRNAEEVREIPREQFENLMEGFTLEGSIKEIKPTDKK